MTDLPAPCPSRISLEKWQAPQSLLGPLNELKSHGFDTLLQGLFWDLKVATPRPGPAEACAQDMGVGGMVGAWLACGRHGVGLGVERLVCPARGRGGLNLAPTILGLRGAAQGWEDTEKLQRAPAPAPKLAYSPSLPAPPPPSPPPHRLSHAQLQL